jgi:hypothetical protein
MIRPLACLVLAAVAAGCVAIRGSGNQVRPLAVDAQRRGQTVSVVVSTEAINEGAAAQTGYGSIGSEYRKWAKSVEEAFRDSGLFAGVLLGLEPADQQMRVHIARRQNVSQPAFVLSASTAAVIPVTWSCRYTVQISLTRADGSVATFESSEAQRVWMHLLLFPAAPFLAPGKTSPTIVHGLTLEALARAQHAGVI